MIQIFSRGEPVSRSASGYREEGWDWLRPPGATVIRVPLSDLRSSVVGRTPPTRIYTRESFVGGTVLEDKNGLWAMQFSDPYFDKSFRFRKSVFFVDETIVCLGSDTRDLFHHPAASRIAIFHGESLHSWPTRRLRPEPLRLSASGVST
jgi:chondroitin-sulfate-ABC endolyase/exolyase